MKDYKILQACIDIQKLNMGRFLYFCPVVSALSHVINTGMAANTCRPRYNLLDAPVIKSRVDLLISCFEASLHNVWHNNATKLLLQLNSHRTDNKEVIMIT